MALWSNNCASLNGDRLRAFAKPVPIRHFWRIFVGTGHHGLIRPRAYSTPMCSPFSATERFMNKTRKMSAMARTEEAQKTSK